MHGLTGFMILTGLTCVGGGSRSGVGTYSLVSSSLELDDIICKDKAVI